MTPQIVFIKELKIIGISHKLSLTNDTTFQLWRTFMPRRNEIKNKVNGDLISIRYYNPPFSISNFSPNNEFIKVAGVVVNSNEALPQGMETFSIPAGKYAKFNYKGLPQNGGDFFKNIFTNWLPMSGLQIDHRPHFDIMGEKYKYNHPESEEELWFPVK